MSLERIIIRNFRSIKEDDVSLSAYTFFIGRNNVGKSNYLKAIDILLSWDKTYKNFDQMANDKNSQIEIIGYFKGCEAFLPSLKESKHQKAVTDLTVDGLLALRVAISTEGKAERTLYSQKTNAPENVTGIATNLAKIFPESIFVPATADTADELQDKSSTALAKIKKEVLQVFFASLAGKVKDGFESVDKYLHGDEKIRAKELVEFEKEFDSEFMGEFSSCKSRVQFDLPDEEMVGKGMRIFLNDGHHESEIPEKGHGLQRTAFFAMLKLLARKATGASSKPKPIFLIEEIEAFLHPTAQAKLVSAILLLTKNYQMIVSTHSPFVISVDSCHGLRLVIRDANGTQALGPQKKKDDFKSKDYESIKNNLKYSRHMTALFADKIIIVEGKNDDGFYPKAHALLGFAADGKLIEFLPALGGGVTSVRVAFKFFSLLGLQDIGAILDLDALFKNDTKHFLKDLNLDENLVDKFRKLIGWTKEGDPSLNDVLAGVKANAAVDPEIEKACVELKKRSIFLLRKGAPEHYYSDGLKARIGRASVNEKRLWEYMESKDDLLHTDELSIIFRS
jgi:predicted ATPase